MYAWQIFSHLWSMKCYESTSNRLYLYKLDGKKMYFCRKTNLHIIYHFDLKRTVFVRTKFFNGQNFIKKCNKNVTNVMQNSC